MRIGKIPKQLEVYILKKRLNNISELRNDLALAIGFALSFGLCYNVWANDLCNISELKNEYIRYGINPNYRQSKMNTLVLH